MSAIAAHAPVLDVVEVHAVDPEPFPADGAFLPAPRAPGAFATAAFVLATSGSAVVAWLACQLLMYAMSTSLTIGSTGLVLLLGGWATSVAVALVVAGDRGEWG